MRKLTINHESQEQLCSGCDKWYPFTNFTKDSSRRCGISIYCRQCTQKQWRRYRSKNIQEHRLRATASERRRRELNPEKSREAIRRYAERHPDKIRAQARNRGKINPQYYPRIRYRNKVREWMLFSKSETECEILVGCTRAEFRKHIESQFKSGMNWSNYGNKRDNWQLDHIIPVMAFDLTDEADRRRCFHYSNTQPLWRMENNFKLKEDLRLVREQRDIS